MANFLHKLQQREFSSILFDTLFGMVIYFSLDSFLEITEPIHFLFYLSSLMILIHWWLEFKSADDTYGGEVTDSVADIALGVAVLVLLEYVVLSSAAFNYVRATTFLIWVLLVDILWAVIFRFYGGWAETDSEAKMDMMDKELERNITADFVTIVMLAFLAFSGSFIEPIYYVAAYYAIYLIYVSLTFKLRIIDIDVY